MSDTKIILQRKINSATELHSVVRTMKAIAAASIGQFESAILALAAYDRAVQLSLSACLRQLEADFSETTGRQVQHAPGLAIVFGSDQGLVGQFNDVMAEFVESELTALPGKTIIWTVGERIQDRLMDAGYKPTISFKLPKTIHAITQLLGEILQKLEDQRIGGRLWVVSLFHNQPNPAGSYQPVRQQLLPLDEDWQKNLTAIRWPGNNVPEVLDANDNTLVTLVREYLFVTIFRTCAESLASENASRLTTMQRAEKNIEDLLDSLRKRFHRLRQGAIDEELFDVISGFEALEVN